MNSFDFASLYPTVFTNFYAEEIQRRTRLDKIEIILTDYSEQEGNINESKWFFL